MSAETPEYVLDSFALLAFLQDEPGGDRIKAVLAQAEAGRARLAMAIVNLGEAIYIIEREKGLTAAHAALAAIDQLPITLVDADRSLTLSAAHIKANHALAYADAFAAALAESSRATLLTGDPEFRQMEEEIKIEWLPQI